MALTSNDETDLLLPLYRGMQESNPFETFLGRLRRRTGARKAWLLQDHPVSLAAHWLIPADPGLPQRLRPFRVYALAEVAEIVASVGNNLDIPDGILDARIVRIPLDDGASGWLAIDSYRPCTASDSALLSGIAPYLQSVLITAQNIERERAATDVSASGLKRSGTGWIMLDADARVLTMDASTRQRLAAFTKAAPINGERLRGLDSSTDRQLIETAHAMATGGEREPEPVVLFAAPRVDALLTHIVPGEPSALHFPTAAMIAWCRFGTPAGAGRCRILAGLHDLPAREAELAMALADGLSIAQAAAVMDLTLETARNYSKRLYAKLDVSGQAQLVRLVHRSGAMLA